jgi:cytochrome c oxidase subunit 3
MFFVAWFWAYFGAALYPTDAIGHVWPPATIETFNPWELPFVNTLILLLSGTTVTWAHHALLHDDRKGLIQGLTLTVILGVLFTACQIFEYSHAAFGFTDGIYASTFYMATGFHGFHVFIGTVFLLVCLLRAMKGHFKSNHHFGFEAAAWYWHFVDVVWLFLFAAIYWWGAGPAH